MGRQQSNQRRRKHRSDGRRLKKCRSAQNPARRRHDGMTGIPIPLTETAPGNGRITTGRFRMACAWPLGNPHQLPNTVGASTVPTADPDRRSGPALPGRSTARPPRTRPSADTSLVKTPSRILARAGDSRVTRPVPEMEHGDDTRMTPANLPPERAWLPVPKPFHSVTNAMALPGRDGTPPAPAPGPDRSRTDHTAASRDWNTEVTAG